MGKFLEHFQAAMKALSTNDPVLRVLAIGRQLGYAFYLMLDALQWVNGSKAYVFEKETATRISKNAARFWLFGISCSLVSGIYKTYMLVQRQRLATRPRATAEKEAERRVELHQISSESVGVRLQMLQDFCDWLNPLSNLDFVSLSDGTVGLAGTLSSLLGARSQWIKVNGAKK